MGVLATHANLDCRITRAVMTDYHKDTPQAVRMPDGLKARVKAAAKHAGETVNGFIVAAIEERLQRHERGATTPARPARNGATTSRVPVGAKQRQRGPCPHRVRPGAWCKTCERIVEGEQR